MAFRNQMSLSFRIYGNVAFFYVSGKVRSDMSHVGNLRDLKFRALFVAFGGTPGLGAKQFSILYQFYYFHQFF